MTTASMMDKQMNEGSVQIQQLTGANLTTNQTICGAISVVALGERDVAIAIPQL